MGREMRKEVKSGFGGQMEDIRQNVLTDSGEVSVNTDNRNKLHYGILDC